MVLPNSAYFCSGRDVCYFCVYTFHDFKVCKIERDNDFIGLVLQHLNHFITNISRKQCLNVICRPTDFIIVTVGNAAI